MNLKVRDLPAAVQRALASVGYKKTTVGLTARRTYTLQSLGGSGRSFTCVVRLDTGEHETHMGSWGGPNMFTKLPADVDDTKHDLDEHTAVIYGSGGTSSIFASVYVNPEVYAEWTAGELKKSVEKVAERAAAGDLRAKEQLVAMDKASIAGESLETALRSGALSAFEKSVLEAHRGLTSAGRKKEFERWVSDASSSTGHVPFGGGIYGWKGEPASGATWREKAADAQRQIDAAIDALVSLGYLKRNKAGAVAITPEGKNILGSRY